MANYNFTKKQQKEGENFLASEETAMDNFNKKAKENRKELEEEKKQTKKLKDNLEKLIIKSRNNAFKDISEIEDELMLIFENTSEYEFLRDETKKTKRREIAKYISEQSKFKQTEFEKQKEDGKVYKQEIDKIIDNIIEMMK